MRQDWRVRRGADLLYLCGGFMPTHYTVQQGDCISSIAAKFGLPFGKIWNAGENATLKQQRNDPNVLFPGDVVVVPDKVLAEEDRPTDALHRFKKKGQPTRIKLRLLLDFQARGGVKYQLDVGGRSFTGTTDGDGYLDQEIPPDAATGTLVVTEGTVCDVFQLSLGAMDPIDTDDGVKKRLANLGYDTDGDLASAVKAFQTKENMDANGTVDDALRAKLKEVFGQ